jgi:hypothetical protein
MEEQERTPQSGEGIEDQLSEPLEDEAADVEAHRKKVNEPATEADDVEAHRFSKS